MATILVVDDELSLREFLQILFEGEGYEVTTVETVAAALEVCRHGWPDVVFADLKLPDGTGMDVLRWIRENNPDCQVIMMTAYATAENAVEAMRIGAYDYQLKPFKVDEIRVVTQKALEKQRLLQENRELRSLLRNQTGFSRIIHRSGKMAEVVGLVEKVAPTRANVLIEGESGTGKELVARAIHDGSPRSQQPFVAINCAALPESLIESELFGHSAGAFTGANRARPGLIKNADGGTLLLDEVGELPGATQAKLLRTLEERTVRAVGEERELPVDVRIVASTNRDLQAMVGEKTFREDLFYRLNVVRVSVPPLRERPEDISVLARAFVVKYAAEMGKDVEAISPEALRALRAYRFPGNVRELENCVERSVALAGGPQIELGDLPEEVRGNMSSGLAPTLDLNDGGIDLARTLQDMEVSLIESALKKAHGVKTQAAQLLGLSFRSLRYRMQKLGLESDGKDPAGKRGGDDEE